MARDLAGSPYPVAALEAMLLWVARSPEWRAVKERIAALRATAGRRD